MTCSARAEDGCHKGSSCEFCHSCDSAEALRRAKRQHVAKKRQEQRIEASAPKRQSAGAPERLRAASRKTGRFRK
eukprot:g33196.t1